MKRRVPSTWQVLACCALANCSQLIGSDELEYTLNDAGVEVVQGIFEDCAGVARPVPINIDGLFCIDSTEVTKDQYREFLEADPVVEQPLACTWNTSVVQVASFEPLIAWPPKDDELDHPVVWIDWCDAWSYCHWAGKRLCSRVGGGPPDMLDFDTTRSEYFFACSQGGQRAYPYGDTFDPARCPAAVPPDTLPVASLDSCQGPHSGLFDLSGNVSEWLGLCTDMDGATDICRIGPAGVPEVEEPPDVASCGRDNVQRRDSTWETIGFRCCSDAL